MKKITLLLLVLLNLFTFLIKAQKNNECLLFVGSYTEGKPDTGIYFFSFNTASGELKLLSHVDQITNPSYICISPNGKTLYACTDTKLPKEGNVASFKIDSINGKLFPINKQTSGGENPVYLNVHNSNRYLVNGNYTSGNASTYSLNADGSINPYSQLIQFTDSSIIRERQEKAHIHSVVFSPKQDYIFLPDLGADKIRVFKFDSNALKPLVGVEELNVKSQPGSGPRHFTFHPNGNFAYCVEELSGMISVYAYRQGKLDSIQRIFSYSKTQKTYGSADIHISPDGLFLYASNRWVDENTISIYSINQSNGHLKLVGYQSTFGDHPRNFTIDPTGNYLLVANMVSNNIVVFKRDLKTGLLTKTKQEVKVFMPSCLQMRIYKQ